MHFPQGSILLDIAKAHGPVIPESFQFEPNRKTQVVLGLYDHVAKADVTESNSADTNAFWSPRNVSSAVSELSEKFDSAQDGIVTRLLVFDNGGISQATDEELVVSLNDAGASAAAAMIEVARQFVFSTASVAERIRDENIRKSQTAESRPLAAVPLRQSQILQVDPQSGSGAGTPRSLSSQSTVIDKQLRVGVHPASLRCGRTRMIGSVAHFVLTVV